MKVTLELNQKFGRGYQIHIVHGPVDSVYDDEPLSMTDAGGYVGWLLEEMNKKLGTNFEPHEVLSVAHDGLVGNKNEFMSRRFLKDIESGNHELSQPPEQTDYRTDENGVDWLSERGTLLFAYGSWVGEGKKDDKGMKFLRDYCRLLASKGYGGGAEAIFRSLSKMELDDGIAWCKRTYAKYVGKYEIVNLMNEL